MSDKAKLNNTPQTVLVVDNLDETRELLNRWLTKEGYRVLEAKSGVQAVELALHEQPDLILMDIKMPLGDGLSATRELRAQPFLRDVPIVAFSGDNTQFNREAAQAAGCNEFLAKPLAPEELSTVLRRFLPVRDAQVANS
ncbi:MAG: response regulator [Acidobacteria bacterium]|nr:MAG: response regulator [Acidobacteriota bacterium]